MSEGALERVRALLVARQERVVVSGNVARVFRRDHTGRSILVNVRVVEPPHLLQVSFGVPTPPVKPEQRGEVLVLLNALNQELSAGAFVLGREQVNLRMHLALRGDDGDASALVWAADYVLEVAGGCSPRIEALVGPAEFEIEPDLPPAVPFQQTLETFRQGLDRAREQQARQEQDWTGAGEQPLDDDHLD